MVARSATAGPFEDRSMNVVTKPLLVEPLGAETARVDRERLARLMQKHDCPAPRYTSYPTAVDFDDSVTAADQAGALEALGRRESSPVSVYVHLPFCEERCAFCGCHVIATKRKDRVRSYLDLVKREIDLVSEKIGSERPLGQLHFGGGTPTYFAPEDLRALCTHLFRRFPRDSVTEMAVEVDPRVTRMEHLEVLRDVGFDRISLGVQDLDPQVQKHIGREQSRGHTEALIDVARRLGYGAVNVDLIYGLPGQTARSFLRTVRQVIDWKVDRIAAYSFAYLPGQRRNQQRIPEELMAHGMDKVELFLVAREEFLGAGYVAIGMDHFALASDELARARERSELRRNFQGYTTFGGFDILAFGVSAIGDLPGLQVQNLKQLAAYERRIQAGQLPIERGLRRTREDEVRADVIQRIMCNGQLDFASIEAAHGPCFGGSRFEEFFAPDLARLEPLRADGLVECEGRSFRVTDMGDFFLRIIARCFDSLWWAKHALHEPERFSRSV